LATDFLGGYGDVGVKMPLVRSVRAPRAKTSGVAVNFVSAGAGEPEGSGSDGEKEVECGAAGMVCEVSTTASNRGAKWQALSRME
jgi:hypothetical protein